MNKYEEDDKVRPKKIKKKKDRFNKSKLRDADPEELDDKYGHIEKFNIQ